MLSPLRGFGSVSLRYKAPGWADGAAYALRRLRVPRAADVLSEVEGLVRPCDGRKTRDTDTVGQANRGTGGREDAVAVQHPRLSSTVDTGTQKPGHRRRDRGTRQRRGPGAAPTAIAHG